MTGVKKIKNKKLYLYMVNKKISEKIILERAISTKICRVCKEEKAYEDLAKRGKFKHADIYKTYNLCKKCDNKRRQDKRNRNWSPERKEQDRIRRLEKGREYVKANPEKTRNYRLKKYGVTLNWLYQKIIDQEFKCTICETHIDEKSAVIDHCHDKNYVRGVICNKCNTAIGFFKNNTNSMKNAIKYLEERIDESWF
jgi:hypothetical protein